MYKKKVLMAAGGVILLVLLAARFALAPGLSAFKHRVEVETSKALGMPVTIKGRLSVAFLPGLAITFRDLRAGAAGVEVIKAEKVKIWLEFGALMRRELKISRLDIIAPVFRITRAKPAAADLKEPAGLSAEKPFTLERLNILRGRLVYAGEKTWEKAEAGGLSLTLNGFSYGGPVEESPFRKISFTGDVKCGTLNAGGVAFAGVFMTIKAINGIFTVSRFSADILGGLGKGSLKADMTSVPPDYILNFTLSRFHIEELFKTLSSGNAARETLEGPADLAVDLNARGKNADEISRSLRGSFSMRGKDLVLHGMDIDAIIARFERSQNFNLLDAGAFLLAGPIGTVLTKSYNFTDLALSRGKEGAIRQFASSWKLKNGVAEAEDAAFSSQKQRLAVKGGINFADGRFENMTVAVLDKRGCAAYSQKINGSPVHPRIGKMSMLGSLTGPVSSILGDVEKLIPGIKCKVFYSGSVPQPGG